MRSVFILFFLLVPVLLLAQGSSTSASHLKFAGTARSASTGQSFVADAGRYTSLSVNPANLSSGGSYELLLSHTQWIQNVTMEFIGARVPASFGTLSFSIANTNVADIELRDRPGPPLVTFTARAAVFQIAFARNIAESFVLGVAGKYLYEKIFIDEATGIAGDLGLLYKSPIDGLSGGLALTNLGRMNEFRETSSDLPAELRAGGSYAMQFEQAAFTVAFAFSNELNASRNHLQLGAEAEYDRLVSLRLGYQTGYESRNFSGGIGIRYSLFTLDYAYVPFSLGLGDAHIVSLGFEL